MQDMSDKLMQTIQFIFLFVIWDYVLDFWNKLTKTFSFLYIQSRLPYSISCGLLPSSHACKSIVLSRDYLYWEIRLDCTLSVD